MSHLPQILNELKSDSPDVRIESLKTLIKITPEYHLVDDDLKFALNDSNQKVACYAAITIGKLASTDNIAEINNIINRSELMANINWSPLVYSALYILGYETEEMFPLVCKHFDE